MQSENLFHSFQSVWAKSNHRPCTYDEEAEPDPEPLPEPGRDNPNCLYNIDDLTIQYSVILHVDMDEKIRIRESGDVDIIKPPAHVKWKWLINWAKAAQCNKLFKQVITPYGTFVIVNHVLFDVHFPTEEDARFVARFQCYFKLSTAVKPGSFVDITNDTIITTDQFANSIGLTKFHHAVWDSFGRDIPLGFKDVKWSNILDTWRYCYVFDNVLDDNDKKYGENKNKKFNNTVELFTFAMYQQFNWWFACLRKQVDEEIQRGVSRHSTIDVGSQWSNYVNGVKLKDIPTEEEFQHWHFVKGWVYRRWSENDFRIGSRHDRINRRGNGN